MEVFYIYLAGTLKSSLMKRIISLLFIFTLGINIANAKPVTSSSAKTVAENFYKQNSQIEVVSAVLFYTEVSATGLPVFYVFNINENDGYVIVTAEDAAKPILGYSTKNHFVIPETSTGIGHWLKYRSSEINALRTQQMVADAKTAKEWAKYSNNNNSSLKLNGNASIMSSGVQPLVQSTWNQSPFYNALCPGKSVTGCVATAMAQIMRYWNYPAQGTGSSSYCDCTPNYSNNYGTLSANYGTTTYNWANMPLNLTSNNADVAKLMLHCGISVDMDYDPSGSGAWVITGDDPICAQNSYVTYFGYDPNKIKGLYRSNYDDSTWIALLQSDLNIGRPIQYVGDDPVEGDGHTWVCDGYDQNNYFHMNWGWGGSDDGFFSINNLLTTNGGFNPSADHEALMGIVPIFKNAYDAGITAITSPIGFYCTTNFNPAITLQNFGATTLTSCSINYQIDNGSLQTQNWSGSMVSGQVVNLTLPNFTATAGTHTLICFSSNPNNSTDQNTANDQSTIIFKVTPNGGILPIVEGFETTMILPSSNWDVSHTLTNGVDWSVTTNGAATGSKSCMINNTGNVSGNNSMLQTFSSYDLTTFVNPALSFKIAYQAKTTSINDELRVSSSINCGAGWSSRWTRMGSTLPTISGTSSSYIPASTDFITYTVNISSIATSPNVLFRWEYTDPNGAGNNLYLDDINLFDAGLAGIQTIEAIVNLNLYPNPSANQVNIGFNLSEKHLIAVQVTDMLGRTVETIDAKSYQTGESTLTIGAKENYQAGIYLVNINIDGQRISKKVVIQ